MRLRDRDVAPPLALCAVALAERVVAPDQEGPLGVNLLVAAAMTLPFVWRRTHLLAMTAVVLVAVGLGEALTTTADALFTSMIVLIGLGYVAGRHHEGGSRWIAVAATGVFVTVLEGVSADPAVPFVWLLLGAGVAGGMLLRRRAQLTRELAERTHELEALRSLRERDAVLDERRRIARELHDVVAHTVSIMVVQAGGARRQLSRDPQRALAALDQVDATGREALAELDRLFGLLRSDGAAPCGLADLPGVVARAREAGLPATLEVTGDVRALPADADLAAFRLVQEALTNTLKHAGPGAAVAVSVRWQDDAVQIAVTDTGHGLEGPRGEGSRRGLEGMRERLAAFGGVVEAGPRAGGGFEVRARLPVGAREEVPA